MNLDDHHRIEIEESLARVEEAPYLLALYDAVESVMSVPARLRGWWVASTTGQRYLVYLMAFYVVLIAGALWKARHG